MKQLSDFTDVELKAAAFEQIQIRDQAQQNLNVITQELRNRQQKPTANVESEQKSE